MIETASSLSRKHRQSATNSLRTYIEMHGAKREERWTIEEMEAREKKS